MRQPGMCVVLTGAVVCLTGCGMPWSGPAAAKSGGLAVVDLGKIAAETGKDIQLRESFQLQENNVKQQLAQAQVNANSQFQDKVKEFGETPTDDQQKELAKFRMGATNALGQLQNQAGTKLNQYMQDQIAKFRAEIKPIAMEVAAKRGLSVVVPKNEGILLAVDPGVDITEDVIKLYRERRPAAAAAPSAPKAAKPAAEAAPTRTATKGKDAKEATK